MVEPLGVMFKIPLTFTSIPLMISMDLAHIRPILCGVSPVLLKKAAAMAAVANTKVNNTVLQYMNTVLNIKNRWRFFWCFKARCYRHMRMR
jgi:hypothetical protein